MKIIHVAGARPNFMKVAPVLRALQAYPQVTQYLVHTGQHYDANMSQVFFDELELPVPDINLGVGSGSHAVQTAQIMTQFEQVLLEQWPDLVLVYGDVNSTVAAALVGAKLSIPVGHVEAGLRSFDRSMPEEINRLLTDQMADLLFTPSADADANLRREGIPAKKIHFVGNVMIDTLVRLLPQAATMGSQLRDRLDLAGNFGLVTLHRPSNVDESHRLAAILAALDHISGDLPLLFPVHPRTRQRIAGLSGLGSSPALQLIDPLSYLEFLGLMKLARLVITDSGGVQEETTYLGVPCLTLRENTERPITTTLGTNRLIGHDVNLLKVAVSEILSQDSPPGQVLPLWDGQAGERIAAVITATT